MQHDLTEKKELNPEQVILAYANGYFPMAEETEDSLIYWHKPKKRAVFILKKLELRKSLIKLLEAETFTFTINTAFDSVIDGCADRDSTWISEEILEVYKKLNRMGFAYSFEAWQDGKLAGGLYGIVLGKVFFGESMFHTIPGASKATFAFLVNTLKDRGFRMIDSQYLNHFTEWLGAKEISDKRYMKILLESI
jgi:leucyl/phenylalanyl-tRNA--protein transferase